MVKVTSMYIMFLTLTIDNNSLSQQFVIVNSDIQTIT